MIEKRGRVWWYRFQHQGKEIRRSTGLAATKENQKDARQVEARANVEAATVAAGMRAFEAAGAPVRTKKNRKAS